MDMYKIVQFFFFLGGGRGLQIMTTIFMTQECCIKYGEHSCPLVRGVLGEEGSICSSLLIFNI